MKTIVSALSPRRSAGIAGGRRRRQELYEQMDRRYQQSTTQHPTLGSSREAIVSP